MQLPLAPRPGPLRLGAAKTFFVQQCNHTTPPCPHLPFHACLPLGHHLGAFFVPACLPACHGWPLGAPARAPPQGAAYSTGPDLALLRGGPGGGWSLACRATNLAPYSL
jgi:hypothetical protein